MHNENRFLHTFWHQKLSSTKPGTWNAGTENPERSLNDTIDSSVASPTIQSWYANFKLLLLIISCPEGLTSRTSPYCALFLSKQV